MIHSKILIGLAGASLVSSLALIAPSSASAGVAPVIMSPCYNDVENGGLAITQSGGTSTYGAAANWQYSRSENIWGTASGCVNLPIGRRLAYSFDIKPLLGPTGPSVWNTVSQLQGPTTNGTWPGPPVAVVIESGQWRVAGGYAVPNGQGGFRTDLGYTISMSKVKIGTWQHLTLDVLLGGPGVGTVTAWVDGTRWINSFHPAAGTMFTVGSGYNTAYLQMKTGEYTGAGSSADIPTWQRTVQVKNVSYSLQ